jgi:hypothetical protein
MPKTNIPRPEELILVNNCRRKINEDEERKAKKHKKRSSRGEPLQVEKPSSLFEPPTRSGISEWRYFNRCTNLCWLGCCALFTLIYALMRWCQILWVGFGGGRD